MIKIAKVIILVCLPIISFLEIVSCGTVTSVRPIGKGRSAITFSSGGPVTTIFDIKMPIPYSVLRYRKGLNNNIDFHLGLHTTMLVLGNIGLDAGVTKHLISQSGWRPALLTELSLYGLYHMNEFSSIKAFPAMSVIASYQLTNKGHALYFGIQGMAQYTDPYLVFSTLIGFEVPLGARLQFNLETKWYAPNEASENRVVDYEIKPFDYGAVGFVWGISYKF